ncbi:CGNR zinc finger domain-containing protein [Halomonas sp. AOP43-A1-21]|uniref:CGNR zinc finger domain-containing protein n=1 Tax=Halomonas colorata TaxID=2742615 RepID=UPI0018673ADF|nr:ABATE domain-containing protein [Halomonas colorata]
MPSHITSPLIAGNLAIDFINTQFGVGEEHQECLTDSSSVITWLQQAGVLSEYRESPPPGLAHLARELRDNMRELLISAQQGRSADPAVINHVLERGCPLEKIEWQPAEAAFQKKTYRRNLESESLLQPVAWALVQLLTEEDVQLVKECEASDCILLFHDQTKSHRRRWCSMASCGNRMKAAAHRARKKTG